MSIINIENLKLERHAMSTESVHLNEILSPLKQICSITHFGYQKLYSGKKAAFISTHPAISKIFLEGKFYRNAFLGNIEKYHSCIALGDYLEGCNPFIQAVRESQNIAHHFAIIKKQTDYVEFFFFAANAGNYQINNYYLNNLDILENFIRYFKEKAATIIKKAERQMLFYPNDANDLTYLIKSSHSSAKTSNNILSHHPHLSIKEHKLLNYIIKGLSAKEIAQQCHLSPRTIEKQIAQIRFKMNCKNIKSLVIKILEQKMII